MHLVGGSVGLVIIAVGGVSNTTSLLPRSHPGDAAVVSAHLLNPEPPTSHPAVGARVATSQSSIDPLQGFDEVIAGAQ